MYIYIMYRGRYIYIHIYIYVIYINAIKDDCLLGIALCIHPPRFSLKMALKAETCN